MARFAPAGVHEKENVSFIKEQISTGTDPALACLNLGYTSPSGVWHTGIPGLGVVGRFALEIPVKGSTSESARYR